MYYSRKIFFVFAVIILFLTFHQISVKAITCPDGWTAGFGYARMGSFISVKNSSGYCHIATTYEDGKYQYIEQECDHTSSFYGTASRLLMEAGQPGGCYNGCVAPTRTASCNEVCLSQDSFSGCNTCTLVSGPVHRCRNAACDTETDCTCATVNTPTNIPTLSPTPLPTYSCGQSGCIYSSQCTDYNNYCGGGICKLQSCSAGTHMNSANCGCIQNFACGVGCSQNTDCISNSCSGGKCIDTSCPAGYHIKNSCCTPDLVCPASCSNYIECVSRTCTGSRCENPCGAGYIHPNGDICTCIPQPTCGTGDVSLNVVSPNSSGIIYQGDTIQISYSSVPRSSMFYKMIANTFTPFLFSSACSPTTTQSPCYISSTYPIINSLDSIWGQRFQYCNNTYTNICSTECSVVKTIRVNQYSGYLITRSGVAYVQKDINMPKFPPLAQYFSTYTFSTRFGLTNYFPSGVSARLSSRNFISTGYDDANSINFDDIKNQLNKNPALTKKVIIGTNFNYIQDDGSTAPTLYQRDGDLNVNSGAVCNKQAIIIVKGDLTFNGNFSVNSNSACLFIVTGNTKIDSRADIIFAYIITDIFNTLNITSGPAPSTLIVKGGVVTNKNNFNRNINFAQILPTTPSEIIEYEGARYIKLFGQVLQSPIILNIREAQYNK